jgi:predicted deacylase
MEIEREVKKRKDGYYRITEYYTAHTGVVSVKASEGDRLEEGDTLYTISRLGLLKKRTSRNPGVVENVNGDIEGTFCGYHVHVLDLAYRLSADEVQSLEDERSFEFVRAPQGAQYYLTPNPGMPPLVSVGDNVEPGTIVAIAMVMKKRREIVYEGERGRIARIYFMNGQQCGEGEKLFGIIMRKRIK